MRANWIIWMMVLFVALTAFACGGSDDASVDGDADGDAPDGDDPDGDEPDGDDPDGDTDGDEEFQYPDPAFIFEVRTPAATAADEPYMQEFSEQFHRVEQLPSLDVKALAVIGAAVYLGAVDGLYQLNDTSRIFEAMPLGGAAGAVHAIADELYEGKLAVALAERVDLIDLGGSSHDSFAFTDNPVIDIAVGGGKLVAATQNGLYEHESNGGWTLITGSDVHTYQGLDIADDGTLYAATDNGVRITGDGGSETWSNVSGELLDNDARAVAVCGSRVAVATASGLSIVGDGDPRRFLAQPDGFPTDNLIAVTCSDAGFLVGHEVGATFLSSDYSHIDHYASIRWTPGLRAPAVALSATGERWIGTEAGAGRIYLIERTLADKEPVFDSMVPHFWRMGGFFASDGRVDDPWADPDTMTLNDKDNDGLWTQMMIGGWCMAYAATGEEKYYDYARKAMDNMFLLVDIPAISFERAGLERGFISRSIVRDDEGSVWESKLTQDNWHQETWEEQEHVWKDDTSSDELAGHFFGFPVFYDLCAKTQDEKDEIAAYADEVARYIVEGGFKLIDLDGERTLHGHWDPDTISIAVDGVTACLGNGYEITDCGEAFYGGGWLNSLEALGMLLAAYHMTGDSYFYDAYELLHTTHRYAEVAMAGDDTLTIVSDSIANHSDHELATLAYTSLIRYEADDARRADWIESYKFMYDHERPERNPWWAAAYALSGGADPDVDSALRTLREMPDDLREWHVNHAHRKDHVKVVDDRHGHEQIDRVYPYDELRTMWWNGNPYSMSDGGDGSSYQAPTNWLLPYYMGLYSGIIQSGD